MDGMSSSDCPSCAEAEKEPDTGCYHTGCLECTARALAHSHPFWESRLQLKMMPRYVEALTKVVGDDANARDAFHRRVKAWAERIAEDRSR